MEGMGITFISVLDKSVPFFFFASINNFINIDLFVLFRLKQVQPTQQPAPQRNITVNVNPTGKFRKHSTYNSESLLSLFLKRFVFAIVM